MKKRNQFVAGILIAASLVFSCSNTLEQNTDYSNNPGAGSKYPYFTVNQDAYGGIASLSENNHYSTTIALYGTTNGLGPFPPCAGHKPDLNRHRLKYKEIKIIDTIKSNITAKIVLHTGSKSNIFTTKGTYLIPTASAFDPNIYGHADCLGINTCGHPADVNFIHETSDFLFGHIYINNDYYSIYAGNYKINSYNQPLNSSFIGKAYKNDDKKISYDITAYFK